MAIYKTEEVIEHSTQICLTKQLSPEPMMSAVKTVVQCNFSKQISKYNIFQDPAQNVSE